MLSYLLAFVFIVLPLASSISLFSSDRAQRRRTEASKPRGVNYGLALAMAVLMTAVLGLVLYFTLFSTFPPVHDATHQLRHGMAVVPCH